MLPPRASPSGRLGRDHRSTYSVPGPYTHEVIDKHAVARALREIGLLLELKGENPYRARAYETGARALEELREDLGTLVDERRLTEVRRHRAGAGGHNRGDLVDGPIAAARAAAQRAATGRDRAGRGAGAQPQEDPAAVDRQPASTAWRRSSAPAPTGASLRSRASGPRRSRRSSTASNAGSGATSGCGSSTRSTTPSRSPPIWRGHPAVQARRAGGLAAALARDRERRRPPRRQRRAGGSDRSIDRLSDGDADACCGRSARQSCGCRTAFMSSSTSSRERQFAPALLRLTGSSAHVARLEAIAARHEVALRRAGAPTSARSTRGSAWHTSRPELREDGGEIEAALDGSAARGSGRRSPTSAA